MARKSWYYHGTMIIIDYSGISVAALFAQNMLKADLDESLLRHMVLNSIRMHNVKFREKYGPDVYLACDDSSWRKSFFPQYKAARKKSREDSNIDWSYIFSVFTQIREELRENSPFKVLHVENAEADDIIAVLAEQTQEFNQHEPVMIVSNDKDFLQLQKFKNVSQYAPVKNKILNEKHPHHYLVEHILRGDSGDGIPNILSDDDTFVTEKRQKPLSKKKIGEILNGARLSRSRIDHIFTDEERRNWQRNQRLIELSSQMIPEQVVEDICEARKQEDSRSFDSASFMNYLIEKRCNRLISSLPDFYTS